MMACIHCIDQGLCYVGLLILARIINFFNGNWDAHGMCLANVSLKLDLLFLLSWDCLIEGKETEKKT